jgi:hypothetical protein
MEKPAEVSRSDGCVWYSHGKTCWSQSKRWVCLIIKHTHRFDGHQQIFSGLYQTHPSPRLTSASFSMTISNTPIVLTDFSRIFHDYIKHSPLPCWSQSKRCVFDIVMENPAEVSQDDGCVWYSHGKTCWS